MEETYPKPKIAPIESPRNKKHEVIKQTNHVGKLTLKREPKMLKYNSSSNRGKKGGNLLKSILCANKTPAKKKPGLKCKLKIYFIIYNQS